MEIVWSALLVLVLLISVGMIFFGLPGTFVIVASAGIYGWATHFEKYPLSFVGILLGIAVGLELIEEFLGAAMAKKFGGSKWAMVGAIAGGFFGAVIGTPMAPVLGTLLGGFIGAFSGATLLEWLHTSNFERSVKVGAGALCGAIGGKITKLFVAIIMAILVIVRLF